MSPRLATAARAMAATSCAALGLVPATASALPTTLSSHYWVFNSAPTTVAKDHGKLIVGGAFNSVAPQVGPLGVVDASDGNAAGTKPKLDGTDAYALAGDGSGGWFVSGQFGAPGGSTVGNRIIHVNADGSRDAAWNTTLNGTARQLVRSGTRLYVAGDFQTINGTSREGLAAVDVTDGSLASWVPDRLVGTANQYYTPPASVYALAVRGTTVYAGGSFGGAGGQPRSGAAAFSTVDGGALPWDPALTGTPVSGGGTSSASVSDLAVDGDDVYLVGSFAAAGGQSRTGLAKVAADTGATRSWAPKVTWYGAQFSGNDGYPTELALSGTTVYVTGHFTEVKDGTQFSRMGAAAFDTGTGATTAWNPALTESGTYYPASVFDLEVAADGGIYIAGAIDTAGGQPRRYLAEVTGTDGTAVAWNPAPFGQVYDVAVDGTRVAFGQAGQSYGALGVTRRGLAELDPATGQPTSWNPTAGLEGSGPAKSVVVSDFAISGDALLAGGYAGDGGHLWKFARTSGTRDTAYQPFGGSTPSSVVSVVARGNTVYVAGQFNAVAGMTSRNRLAAFSVDTGAVLPWAPVLNSGYLNVYLKAADAGPVYAYGNFSSFNGQTRAGLAALDATTGEPTGWNPAPSGGAVNTVFPTANAVYVGGNFTSIGGIARKGFASVDPATAQADSAMPGLRPAPGTFDSTYVRRIATDGTTLYALADNGITTGEVNRWLSAIDLPTKTLQSWAPRTGGGSTVVVDGDELYLGAESLVSSTPTPGPTVTPAPTATPTPTPTPGPTVTPPAEVGQTATPTPAPAAGGGQSQVPTGPSAPAPAGGGAPPTVKGSDQSTTTTAPVPKLAIGGSSLKAKAGAVSVALSCGASKCSGTVTLTTKDAKGRTIVIGSAAATGTSAKVTLTKAGKKLLKGKRKLKVVVSVTAPGAKAASSSATVTLKS